MPRTISWLFLPISLRLRYFVPESVSLQRFWYQICPNSDIAQQHMLSLRWGDLPVNIGEVKTLEDGADLVLQLLSPNSSLEDGEANMDKGQEGGHHVR